MSIDNPDDLHAAVVAVIEREQAETVQMRRERINAKSLRKRDARHQDRVTHQMNAEECREFLRQLREGKQPNPRNV